MTAWLIPDSAALDRDDRFIAVIYFEKIGNSARSEMIHCDKF